MRGGSRLGAARLDRLGPDLLAHRHLLVLLRLVVLDVSVAGAPFAFIGAHYGPVWQMPASVNNSRGVGYCVMEDVGGEGAVAQQPDPPMWDADEMARAAALNLGRPLYYALDCCRRWLR